MMNEIQNYEQVTLSDKDVARLSQLRETLNAAKVDYTLFAHDLTIRSAQEGTEQGFGELASMAPTFILRSEILSSICNQEF